LATRLILVQKSPGSSPGGSTKNSRKAVFCWGAVLRKTGREVYPDRPNKVSPFCCKGMAL